MEQINKVELRGLVGNIKLQEISGRKVARFTLATSSAYTDRNGAANIETQWHNVNAWEGKNIACLDRVSKGSKVHMFGRIRYSKFLGNDGADHFSTEILASRVNLIEGEDALAVEM